MISLFSPFREQDKASPVLPSHQEKAYTVGKAKGSSPGSPYVSDHAAALESVSGSGIAANVEPAPQLELLPAPTVPQVVAQTMVAPKANAPHVAVPESDDSPTGPSAVSSAKSGTDERKSPAVTRPAPDSSSGSGRNTGSNDPPSWDAFGQFVRAVTSKPSVTKRSNEKD